MAKKQNITILPMETKVELVAVKEKQLFRKILNYGDALKVKRKKGWAYFIYQVGFAQYK
ncbi:MAG: hypothetical protein GY745_08485, partial [Actinomycetia bacterium]|nr:hypothetical protein [Actinomycetes bacterium]